MNRLFPALTLMVLIVFLTACSSNTFILSGESESWDAELKVIQHENGFEDQLLKLHYKGKDIRAAGEVSYSLQTDAGGFAGGDLRLNDYGNLEGKSQGNETNAKLSRESDGVVTVEWKDQKEKLTLTKK